MSVGRDPEFTEYVGTRIGWLRRIVFLLCQDWSHADDLVQAAITSLYVHWGRVRAVEHTAAYARTILVRHRRINGYKVTVNHFKARQSVPAEQQVCAADADGLSDTFVTHPLAAKVNVSSKHPQNVLRVDRENLSGGVVSDNQQFSTEPGPAF